MGSFVLNFMFICSILDNAISNKNVKNYSDEQFVGKPETSHSENLRIKHLAVKRSISFEDDPYYHHTGSASKDDNKHSSYKSAKSNSEDYDEYPQYYDSDYDHKEYERIKELSEKQAAEIKQNPQNCKEVAKDGMKCTVCKDPKSGGNYESCSYVADPISKKYAYSKAKNFDTDNEPEDDRNQSQENESHSRENDNYSRPKTKESYEKYEGDDDSGEKSKQYDLLTNYGDLDSHLNEGSEENSEPSTNHYNYEKALPGFYTDNEPKKDVEHVLAEFTKKDRSSCDKVNKNGMTCYQCVDKNGFKNEECMYVSESAPKQSHLAYKEFKKFSSNPESLNANKTRKYAEPLTTLSPLKQRALTTSKNDYGKKVERRRAPSIPRDLKIKGNSIIKPHLNTTNKHKKRDIEESIKEPQIKDKTLIATPEEFAGEDSKGAFWTETEPKYSSALGVTLPEYMLVKSEHEQLFDEAVAASS